MRHIVLAMVFAAMSVTLAPQSATAQTYPSKPIRFIVPFAPGGGSDIVARLAGQSLNEALGQPVVIDNRGGAGSTLGTDLAAKAPSDGYTLLLGNISLAFNATLYKKLPYNAIRDLAPVTLVAIQPNIVVIHPAVPAKSLKEFIDLARSQPGKLTFASAGTGAGGNAARSGRQTQPGHAQSARSGRHETQIRCAGPGAAGQHPRRIHGLPQSGNRKMGQSGARSEYPAPIVVALAGVAANRQKAPGKISHITKGGSS